MSLNNLQLEYYNFIDNSVKVTLQIFYDVGSFNGFENKDLFFRIILHLLKYEEGNWKWMNNNDYLLLNLFRKVNLSNQAASEIVNLQQIMEF